MEKLTDYSMLAEYEKYFNHKYHTENNSQLFGKLIPDGWDIIGETLIIVENKSSISKFKKAEQQMLKYLSLVPKDKFKNVYCLLGFGHSENFQLKIYDNNFKPLKMSLEELSQEFEQQTKEFNQKTIHDLNQYIYDNGINLPKSQKTLFIASVLICLKIQPTFYKEIKDNTSVQVATKMISLIEDYYNDKIFANSFIFLKSSFNNKHLKEVFGKLQINVKDFGKDILKMFYNEFLKYDKNNEGRLGIVLTPHDIVELMIQELEIKETDKVLDFCTGTGSFLLEAGKYSKDLNGCENNEERYSLAKCNFILNDYNYENLKFNSCFNVPYKQEYDKIIINPPFNCKSSDHDNSLNTCHWQNYEKEQKFLMYVVELLKIGGRGAVIIPRSNFNNNINKTNQFKKEFLSHTKILKIYNLNSKIFSPIASVECAIIIFERVSSGEDSQQILSVDYRSDGYELRRTERVKVKEPEPKIKNKTITFNSDWNWEEETNNLNYLNLFLRVKNNLSYDFKNKLLESNEFNDKYLKLFRINSIKDIPRILSNYDFEKINNFEKIRLGDVFELVKPTQTYQIKKSEDGSIPLISRGSQNNGIAKFIKAESGILKNLFTVAPSGSTGFCFYHDYEFVVDGNLKVLKLKSPGAFHFMECLNPHLLSLIITETLTKKYNYNNGLTIEKLLKEEIKYPFLEPRKIEDINFNDLCEEFQENDLNKFYEFLIIKIEPISVLKLKFKDITENMKKCDLIFKLKIPIDDENLRFIEEQIKEIKDIPEIVQIYI